MISSLEAAGEQVLPPPASRARRVRWLPVGLTALTVLLLATAFLPWEWSFIDDGNLLTRLHANQAAHGWLGGIPATVAGLYRADLTWGLFRPSFWVFGGTFYLLPVGLAHAVRLGMLACAFAGPLVLVAGTVGGPRRTQLVVVGWAGAALAASESLYMGVWYPSLQELSGLWLVGLGLLARRHPAVRGLCFLLAAWFKAPFAWLVVAYGLALCRRRETRAAGVASVVLGVGTLVAAWYLTRTGTYTTTLSLSIGRMRGNLVTGLGELCLPLGVLVAGLVVLRPRLDVAADPLAPALLAGGAGYLVNLLGWNAGNYYASPYVYLLTTGALLSVRAVRPVGWRRVAVGAVVPLLLSGYATGHAALAGYRRMATVIGLRDCLLGLPGGPTVGFNRHEAWERLDYIVREHRPGWTGRVALVEAGYTTGFTYAGRVSLDYYIYSPGFGVAAPFLVKGPVVCRTPDATVYRVVP